MKCYKCGKPAIGICRFCGRAVCEEHHTTMPYIISIYVSKDVPKAIVVSDALYCGTCKPHPTPLEMPEIS